VSGLVYKYQHRVSYAECTVGNHVYYSRYLDILERARGEMFRELGGGLLALQEAGTIFPVIGVQVTYKGMARYDDLLTIELFMNQLVGIRINVGFRVARADGTLLAEGETRHVCAGTDEKPKRLPKELIEKFQPYITPATHVP